MGGVQGQNGISRRKRGFERAGALAAGRIRAGSESRGFAVSRLLTHWAEIVGPDIAPLARPVEVGYGRGFGATLTLLTQTAATGFAEGQAVFEPERKTHPEAAEVTPEAREAAKAVDNADLREALERLGANILSQAKR